MSGARLIGSADAQSYLEAFAPADDIGTVVALLNASCRRHLGAVAGLLATAALDRLYALAAAATVPTHCGWYMRLELHSFARWGRDTSSTCLQVS